jgi:hypothetical protein
LAGWRRARLVAVRAPRLKPPHVDGPAARDPVDELGDVVGEPLDRHGAAGVGRVAVALELDADHPAALAEPGEHVAEAAVERENPAVQGDERRSCRVAALLVPDGDAVDLLVGHAISTVVTGRTHRRAAIVRSEHGGPAVRELPQRA